MTATTGSDSLNGDPRANRSSLDFLSDVARAAERESGTSITVPGVGAVRLPSRTDLGFLVGIGVLAAAGAIDGPVAAGIGTGHLCATTAALCEELERA